MNKKVLGLAIPNIISNLSVPLLGAVDTALVGHLSDVSYLGAIAVGSMIFNFLFWGFGFLRMGTTGMTAQAYGRKESNEVALTLVRAVSVAMIGGVLLIVLQNGIEAIAFKLVDTTPDVENYTRLYYSIRIYSAPATLGIYALNGWFLGMQNSRYPMVVTICLNVLNIVLDVSFIYGMGMNVDGAAWGTLIARYAGLIIAGTLFWKSYKKWLYGFDMNRILELEPLKQFFVINRDIFIRTLCLIFTFSFFTAKSASAGEVVLAANSILLQLWMIVSYGIDGFAFSAESLVGKYKGAGKPEKMKRAIGYSFVWGLAIGLLGTLSYGLFGRSILKIFTDQQEVIKLAMTVIAWTIVAPIINSFSYIWDGIYIGATASVPMRNSMLIATLGVFLPVYYLGIGYLGIHALWLAMTLFMFFRALTLTIFSSKHIFINMGHKSKQMHV